MLIPKTGPKEIPFRSLPSFFLTNENHSFSSGTDSKANATIPHITIITLPILRILLIRQIKDDHTVWLSSSLTILELRRKINGAIKCQASIVVDIRIQNLEISRRVDDSRIAGLHEVVDDNDVLLVGCDLRIVCADVREYGVRIIETLGGREVADVELDDVGVERKGEICVFTILSNININSSFFDLRLKIEKQLNSACAAINILAEWVDDPGLAETDCCCDGGLFLVAWDELYVVDAGCVNDGDCAEDFHGCHVPEPEGVGVLDGGAGFQESVGDNEIRAQHDVLLGVEAEAVGTELAGSTARGISGVGKTVEVRRILADDVVVGIGFDETARRRTIGKAHIGNHESTTPSCGLLVLSRLDTYRK